jgi:resuscitation-promoting factor RpfA
VIRTASTKIDSRKVGRRSLLLASGIGGAVIAAQLIGASGASAATQTTPSVLQAIKQCESGGNYTAVNPTSGASGAYQFLTSTWQSLSAAAGYATAAAAPPAVQDAAALELYNEDGTSPWVSSESCWGSLATSTSTGSAVTTSSLTSSLTAAAATPAVPLTGRPRVGFIPGATPVGCAHGAPGHGPGAGPQGPGPSGRPTRSGTPQ